VDSFPVADHREFVTARLAALVRFDFGFLQTAKVSARFHVTSQLDMGHNVKRTCHGGLHPQRVKEHRIQRGWTQQQLVDSVGVSRQSINSIERDRYVPSLLLALTFSRVFACSTDEIFTLLVSSSIGTTSIMSGAGTYSLSE
jgi:putative transcriptional regulator